MSALPGAPDLIKQENSPSQLSLYLKIDLQITLTSSAKTQPAAMTGVYFPDSFKPAAQVNVLLFLHGHDAPSVDEYWSKFHSGDFKLRDNLNQDFILVVPTLSAHADAGKIAESGGITWFLFQVMEGIKKYAPDKLAKSNDPTIKKLVLAAHSGGGRPMRAIAANMGDTGFDAAITDFWGFDCLYDFDTPRDFNQPPPPVPNSSPAEFQWFKWAQQHPDLEVTMHWATPEPKIRCKNLEKMASGWNFKSKAPPKPPAKDWASVFGMPAATTLTNVTIIESGQRDHNKMVLPAFVKQLGP